MIGPVTAFSSRYSRSNDSQAMTLTRPASTSAGSTMASVPLAVVNVMV